MKNQTIRNHAKIKGVFLWEIADKLNIADGSFSRKLRKELSEKETEDIISIIDGIAEERN